MTSWIEFRSSHRVSGVTKPMLRDEAHRTAVTSHSSVRRCFPRNHAGLRGAKRSRTALAGFAGQYLAARSSRHAERAYSVGHKARVQRHCVNHRVGIRPISVLVTRLVTPHSTFQNLEQRELRRVHRGEDAVRRVHFDTTPATVPDAIPEDVPSDA